MVRRVTLGAGALSAAAEGDQRVRANLEALRRHNTEVVLPAVAIAESTTGEGTRDARVNLVIRGCQVASTTELIARRAGALRYRARRPDATVDAIVVATAELVGGGALLTFDREDCTALAENTSVRVEGP
ncbi:MAG: PIN domain-containing protein [Egibacteraceae bacterium]